MTIKNFLAELSFVQLKDIKRHAKGLLIAIEKSNRKELLDYEINLKRKFLACIWCGQPIFSKYGQYCSVKCKKEALGQK